MESLPSMASSVFAVPMQPQRDRPPRALSPRPHWMLNSSQKAASSTDIAPSIMIYNNAIYYTNYHLREGPTRTPASLTDPTRISHVFYSYASVEMDGSVKLSRPYEDSEMMVDGERGGIAAVTALRARNPDLKIILCIGGGDRSLSAAFVSTAADVGKRRRFASTARALVDAYKLDGIDIYWADLFEARQCGLFLELLAEIRRSMPVPRYLLTVALSGKPWLIRDMDLRAVAGYVNLVNLEAFDFYGPWADKAGHCSQVTRSSVSEGNPQSTSVWEAVNFYMAQGMPSEKINVGIPCFGRSFQGATRVGDKWRPTGAYGVGFIPYCDLRRLGEHDVNAGASWTSDGPGGFVSYDDPNSVGIKVNVVKRLQLAGLCFWDAPLDHCDSALSIVTAGFLHLFQT